MADGGSALSAAEAVRELVGFGGHMDRTNWRRSAFGRSSARRKALNDSYTFIFESRTVQDVMPGAQPPHSADATSVAPSKSSRAPPQRSSRAATTASFSIGLSWKTSKGDPGACVREWVGGW